MRPRTLYHIVSRCDCSSVQSLCFRFIFVSSSSVSSFPGQHQVQTFHHDWLRYENKFIIIVACKVLANLSKNKKALAFKDFSHLKIENKKDLTSQYHLPSKILSI